MRAAVLDRRLDAVAGEPAGLLTTVGEVGLPGFAPFGGRTLYFVYETPVDVPNWREGASLGGEVNEAGQVRFQANGTGDAYGTRVDLIGGSANLTSYPTGIVPDPGVVCTWVPDGMNAVYTHFLGFPVVSRSISNPGDGMPTTPLLRLFEGGLATVAYVGVHTDFERHRIMTSLSLTHTVSQQATAAGLYGLAA